MNDPKEDVPGAINFMDFNGVNEPTPHLRFVVINNRRILQRLFVSYNFEGFVIKEYWKDVPVEEVEIV